MEFSEKFKFLNMQLNKRKNDENRYYLVVNLLDRENNPCKFFAFDDDVVATVTARTFQGLQDVTVNFSLQFSNNQWGVRLNDILPVGNK